jgi:hypothetical protein
VSDFSAKEALLTALGSFPGENRDMGEMRTILPPLVEYVQAFGAPDFVCAMVPLPPGPVAEYEGPDGIERAWNDWGAAFESVRADADELIVGDRAVALLATQVVVTRHGSVEMTQPSAMLWLFSDDDRVRRLEFHLDRDAALGGGGGGGRRGGWLKAERRRPRAANLPYP